MGMDRMRLYIRQDYYNKIDQAIFNGAPAAFVYGNDGIQYWIELLDLGMPPQAKGTILPLVITVSLLSLARFV